MPLLIVTCDESKMSQRFLIREERFTVGRSPTATVAISDSSVSKVHLVVSRTSAGWAFQDLWSRNGTFLNEERRDAGELKVGDVLRAGRVRITFLLDADDERPAEGGERTESLETPVRAGRQTPAALAPSSTPRSSLAEEPPSREQRGSKGGRDRTKPVVLGIVLVVIALMAGFLAGKMDGLLRPRTPSGASRGHERPGSDLETPSSMERSTGEAGVDAPTAAGDGSSQPEVDADGGGEASRIAETYLSGPEAPYASPAESERVLFRLCLDILERPPTRAEAAEILPLPHEERWKTISALKTAFGVRRPGASRPGKSRGDGPVERAFRMLLAREPDSAESAGLALAIKRRDGKDGGAGTAILLLSATTEYRSSDFRRPRSVRQRAASFIVDLLDRPPASAEEQGGLEDALESYPKGGSVARVLAFSSDGTKSLGEAPAVAPASPPEGTSPAQGLATPAGEREWAAREARRFLLRAPIDEELDSMAAEAANGLEGRRRVRIALAGLAEYKSY